MLYKRKVLIQPCKKTMYIQIGNLDINVIIFYDFKYSYLTVNSQEIKELKNNSFKIHVFEK